MGIMQSTRDFKKVKRHVSSSFDKEVVWRLGETEIQQIAWFEREEIILPDLNVEQLIEFIKPWTDRSSLVNSIIWDAERSLQ
jgi:hypothetical protein